jgi:hypothetical protein
VIITVVIAIDTTHITSIPGRLIFTTLDLDHFQPFQEIVLSLNTYIFSDTTKTIIKRRTKKIKTRHLQEALQELVHYGMQHI